MKASPRILFVGNFLIRHWGNGRSGIDMRLAAGALRLGWQIHTFSERDIARFLAPLGFMRGIGARMMNARLVKTVKNWKPDVIFISHCDYLTNEAIAECRHVVPGVRIVHINCDSPSGAHTRAQLERRREVCDAIFVTSAGEAVLRPYATGRNLVGFFPNPSDPSFEVEDNSVRTDFTYDLFFAGRPTQSDIRCRFLDELRNRLGPGLRPGFFGIGAPLVVGRAYEEAIAASKMGLSLNSVKSDQWYASDRLTHLMGNGLLTFQQDDCRMRDFFTDRETVYFRTVEELADRIAYFNAHDDERRAVAAAGRAKYHRLFDARRVLKYMMESVLGEPYSEAYEWAAEVYR